MEKCTSVFYLEYNRNVIDHVLTNLAIFTPRIYVDLSKGSELTARINKWTLVTMVIQLHLDPYISTQTKLNELSNYSHGIYKSINSLSQ